MKWRPFTGQPVPQPERKPVMKCSECGLKLVFFMPGAGACDNRHVHIFADVLCVTNGYAPTPENIRILEEVAREMFNAKIED